MTAYIVVFDPDTIMAELPEVVDDLPAGARRLVQRTRGVKATVVNGEVLLCDGQHTGARPGKLLRGPLAQDQTLKAKETIRGSFPSLSVRSGAHVREVLRCECPRQQRPCRSR
jgi:hypothetical protein